MPRRLLLPFLLYLGLACLLTYPGVLRLDRALIGAGDNVYFAWELWWFAHAAFERGISPLSNDTLFYPATAVPLVWSTAVNQLPGMLLTPLVGPVVTYNLLVLAALALAGLGGFMLARHVVGHQGAAFVGGAVFAFAPVHMAHVANGHLGVVTVQWLPFCALAWLRLYEAPSWRRAAAFAATLALVLLSDLYVALYFLAAFFGAVLIHALLRDRARFLDRGLLAKALAAGGAAGAIALPFYWPTLVTMRGAGVTVAMQASVHRFGQDLAQLFLPTPWNPLLGALSLPWTPHITNTDNWGYLGLLPLALALYALTRRETRDRLFWAALTGLATLLAMGTFLHVAGPTAVPLPYWLWSKLPLLENLRAPGRFMLVAALGLAVLAAAGLARLAPRAPWAVPVALVVVGVEYLTFFPFPTTPMAVPDYYRRLAKEPGAGAVLELPNGDPSWGGPTHRWMYYQRVHGRPLVYGHSHRVPDAALAFSRETPVVRELVDLIHTDFRLGLAAEHAEGASERLGRLGITHVILHAVSIMPPGRYQALEGQLTHLFGPPAYRTPEMAVFRTAAGD